MPGSKRDGLIEQARALYAQGLTKRDVAAALEVSPRSIYRWAKADADAGRPWQREGEGAGQPCPATPPASNERGTPIAELHRLLTRKLAGLADRSLDEEDNSKLEDRMLKVCRVIEKLPRGADDPEVLLRAMERFARFCRRNLPQEDMQPVRRAVREFMDWIKEEHS